MIAGKRILLGVTGGIAAYKSAFLVRELLRRGAEVQVVMTRAATNFITPLTLSTLSRREVIVDMFPPMPEQPTMLWTKHIDLALWGDVMLIAPASANTIAKLVHGIADNFMTTLVLALRCPLLVAPAMDVDMYRHATTTANIATLKESGAFVIDPESGELASGLSGPGRLPESEALIAELEAVLGKAPRDLSGRRVLVTAGPTYEPIDPVRFLGNRSSGKMGFALAAAAAQRGAEVTLVSGPVALKNPRNVRRIDVETARDMAAALEREFPETDLLIMAAAVADFSPRQSAAKKIKRESAEMLTIDLVPNPDILRTLGEHKTNQIMVGFALETENGVENARKKLKAKHLDLIVLNNALEEGAGFGADTNTVTIIHPKQETEQLPLLPKIDVAHHILSRAVPLLHAPAP
jgi:phosphopantothenoylcysteine decarboxylase/phosphopantothenate--cysteine ligase